MEFEKEITVTSNISKKDLINFFEVNNYKKVDDYVVKKAKIIFEEKYGNKTR